MCVCLISGYLSKIPEEIETKRLTMLPVVLGVGVFLFLLVFTAVMIGICKKRKFLCQYLILKKKQSSTFLC